MSPRICHDVISQMLEIIPETETRLISDLQWNMEDSFYKAPEETIQWVRTSETLQRHIPIPKQEWEFNILSIFTTNSVEEIKLMVDEHEKTN
jgi:hypothetical protein